MRTVTILWSVLVIGCFPRPEPQPPRTSDAVGDPSSTQPSRSPSHEVRYDRDAAAMLGQAPTAQRQPQPPPPAPPAPPSPPPAGQPYPQQVPPPAGQPYPQQVPPPAPPYPAQPYPAQPYPAQPYPAQPAQPYPAPYPSAGYPQQAPYPTVQPYAAPQAYPPPADAAIGRSHVSDGEVIVDFAAVGTLASIDLVARQDINNGSAATFLVTAGVLAGGATGWLLADKFDVDSGAAHATTIGLLVGVANGALLVQPTHTSNADDVLALLLLGSAVGTTSGFIYGQSAKLTSGQSTLVANLALLGSATAALTAIAGSRDGAFGGWEDGTLAVGLDAGVLGGALIAPSLDWSPKRAKVVFASTAVGAFLGGLLVGLITKPKNGDTSDADGDLVAGCLTAGMWGGFGLGVLMTRDYEPAGRETVKLGATRGASQGPAVTLTPYAGDRGQVGLMAGGSW